MTKPAVFVTRKISPEALARLDGVVDMDVWPEELPPPYETLTARSRGKDGILCLLTDRIDARFLHETHPKVISQMAVGVDNIDLKAAADAGIPVGNTPGVLTETTADFTWALLMAAARRVVEADKYTRAGKWKTWLPLGLLGYDLYGATLGIVGFGRIGQAVARRAKGFGMKILYSDVLPNAEAEAEYGAVYTDLDALLEQSDFITLHTALTPETTHLIGEAQFNRMKPSAVLVNAARGPVVDQPALYRALKSRRIFAAAIDVTEKEPIPPADPLLELDNLVIAPHIASASYRTRLKMANMAVDNLLAGLEGRRLPYCANPEVYEK